VKSSDVFSGKFSGLDPKKKKKRFKSHKLLPTKVQRKKKCIYNNNTII
jgi:hypothetical protein